MLLLLTEAYFELEDSDPKVPHLLVAEKYIKEAIDIADNSSSIRSGADARLWYGRVLIKMQSNSTIKNILNWVIEHPSEAISADQRSSARNLIEVSEGLTTEEVRSVVGAMGDRFGSVSDHWYECPNGHPYFVGECGGVQEARQCPECGSRIGGVGYDLADDNRRGAPSLMGRMH